jgi:undecaprenyl-diphosphatase
VDRWLFRRLNGTGGRQADAFFKAVTELGSIWASVGATVALTAAGRRRQALDALGAAGAMWLVGQAVKKAVRRSRPYEALDGVHLMIEKPRGTSWPSSHPAVLSAFLTVACRNLGAPAPIRAGAAGLVGTVGLSRVYLGVHYPGDVAGGLLLGRAVADGWSALVSPRTLGRGPSRQVQ